MKTTNGTTNGTMEQVENAINRGVNGEHVHENYQLENVDGVTVEIEITHNDYQNGHSETEVRVTVLIEQASRFTPDNMLGYPRVLDDLGDMGDTLAADLEGTFRNGADVDNSLIMEYNKGYNGEPAVYSAVVPVNVFGF